MNKAFLYKFLYKHASSQAKAIADLLIKDTSGWNRDKYRLWHKQTGIYLWVANKSYGLKLEPSKEYAIVYEPLSWIDRKLIWGLARQFEYTDPIPTKIIRNITAFLVNKNERRNNA